MTLHGVDKSSFICRIAHSLAYQMLVAGFFSGLDISLLSRFLISVLLADPHPGNIYCVEGKSNDFGSNPASKKRGFSSTFNDQTHSLDSPTSFDDSWRPGFLDFGMTYR